MGIGNLKLNRWGNLIVVAIFLGGWWMVHNFDWENEILLKFATGPYFWPLLIVMFAIFGYLDWQNKGGYGMKSNYLSAKLALRSLTQMNRYPQQMPPFTGGVITSFGPLV